MWKKYRPKSTIPPAIGVPSMSMCFSGRCQPRGRTTMVGSSPAGRSLYSLPSGEVKSIRRSSASVRFSWPWITLRQDGVEESSMSASHTLAPEFSALMVIFLSTGPVISTRRSSRPGAGGATRQFGSLRTDSVSRRNRGSWPLAICWRRSRRACSSSRRRPAVALCSLATNASASGVRTSPCRQIGCAVNVIPLIVKLSVKLFISNLLREEASSTAGWRRACARPKVPVLRQPA